SLPTRNDDCASDHSDFWTLSFNGAVSLPTRNARSQRATASASGCFNGAVSLPTRNGGLELTEDEAAESLQWGRVVAGTECCRSGCTSLDAAQGFNGAVSLPTRNESNRCFRRARKHERFNGAVSLPTRNEASRR